MIREGLAIVGRESIGEHLDRARELKESVAGNYEHTANIQDYELVEWLIEQTEYVDDVEAENAKLRQALTEITNFFSGTWSEDSMGMRKIAKLALEENSNG